MRCKAIKRDGSRCSLPAKGENGSCWAHDPANAEQRRKAASKAGKTKPSAELHQIKRQLRTIADEVLEGKITTAKGSVAAQVLGVYLRAVEQERKQRELEELEARITVLEEHAPDYRGGYRGWG
jgi:flagellar motility protein MotE (MotC chaperone)